MKKWLLISIVSLVVMAAAGRHILLHWQIFPHVSILAIQRSYHSSIDDYFIEHQFRKPAFQHMFHLPGRYKDHVNRFLLDPDSSAMELEVASLLIQCQYKKELYELGKKIIARFDKATAAQRLMLVFFPAPQASTFHYAPIENHPYTKWLEFIEQHHPYENGKPVDVDITDNAYYTSASNGALIHSPLHVCHHGQNVADMNAFLMANRNWSDYWDEN